MDYLQDVANNAEGPHISGASDRLVADDFWSDELGCAEKNTNGLIRI